MQRIILEGQVFFEMAIYLIMLYHKHDIFSIEYLNINRSFKKFLNKQRCLQEKYLPRSSIDMKPYIDQIFPEIRPFPELLFRENLKVSKRTLSVFSVELRLCIDLPEQKDFIRSSSLQKTMKRSFNTNLIQIFFKLDTLHRPFHVNEGFFNVSL